MATGKKGKSLVPDPRSLASEHHMVIVSCLGFLATKSVSPSNPLKMLIIGLGGGSLPKFIDQHLINVGTIHTRSKHWVLMYSAGVYSAGVYSAGVSGYSVSLVRM